jgi:hypothetical protein
MASTINKRQHRARGREQCRLYERPVVKRHRRIARREECEEC